MVEKENTAPLLGCGGVTVDRVLTPSTAGVPVISRQVFALVAKVSESGVAITRASNIQMMVISHARTLHATDRTVKRAEQLFYEPCAAFRQ